MLALPKITIGSEDSFFKRSICSGSISFMTDALSYLPHVALSSVREKTNFGVLFIASAPGDCSSVMFGQTLIICCCVVRPRKIACIEFMTSAPWSLPISGSKFSITQPMSSLSATMMLSRLPKIDATRFPIELTPSGSFDLNDFDDQLFSSVDLHETTNRPEHGLLITLALFRESPLSAAHPWALSFEAGASRSCAVRVLIYRMCAS